MQAISKQNEVAPRTTVDAPQKRSWASAIFGLIAVTAIAAASGIFTAWHLQVGRLTDSNSAVKDGALKPTEAASLKGLVAKPVPTILTNLAGQQRAWIRVEFAVLLPADLSGADALATAIGQDTIAYLRTVSVAQIEGVNGLSQLRDDLEERARMRSGGKSRGILFKTFVIE